MDSDISCIDTPTCLIGFLRRKHVKMNNVYNVETGKVINNSKSASTHIKYEKYRSNKYEEIMNMSDVSNSYTKTLNYRHRKLQSKLSEHTKKKGENPLEFINELEENSKKIENIFPKCKIQVPEKDYENITAAISKMFAEAEDVAKPLPKKIHVGNNKRIESTTQSKLAMNNPDYEHIKLALRLMFLNVDVEIKEISNMESTARNADEKPLNKSGDIKLQMLVEDVLKQKSSISLENEETSTTEAVLRNQTQSNIWKGVMLRESSVDTSSDENDFGEIICEADDSKNDHEASHRNLDAEIEKLEAEYNQTKIEQINRHLKNNKGKRRLNFSDNNEDNFCSQMNDTVTESSNNSINYRVKTESSVSYGSTRTSLDHLDAILLQMRDVSEKRKELEKEQTETLATLRNKQNELQWKSNCSAAEKVKICDTIESLQSKIRELEKKMELQNVHHEELLLEMAAIKRSAVQRAGLPSNYGSNSWKKPNASNQEVQTSPESNTSELTFLDRLTPSTSNSYDSGNVYESRQGTYRSRQHAYGCLTNIAPSSSYVDLHHASLDPSARYSINTNNAVACKLYWGQAEPPCTCPVISDQELPSVTPSNESACSDDSGIQNVSMLHNSNISVDIDKIMAKIDQDNRILAELDKTRSTIATQGSMTAEQLRTISEMGIIPPHQLLPVLQQAGLPSNTSHPVMISNAFSSYLQQYELGNNLRQPMGSVFSNQMQQLPQLPASQSAFSIMQSGYQGNFSNLMQFDLDTARNIKNANLPGSNFASSSDLLLPHEDLVIDSSPRRSQDMVEIPGKGWCNIFIAKYSYDPFSQSTSVCPEAELAIHAGDYILVYGDPDDDGYVDAELMDGRRGLVPVIFIQKLSGDELLEFKQRVLICTKECDDTASTTIPRDIENLNADEPGRKFRQDYNAAGTTEEEDNDDEDNENESVPAPKHLTLERQLNKSILIRWNAPEDSSSHCIDSYHVYVDGVLKTTIKANERTKALLEGVDSTKPHRISIRSVTQNRRTSRDAACTMLIGKDVPRYPTNVRAHHITPTSAVISWMPSNSNYQHTVCVNNVEVRTVKPGVYRHMITGLVPNTIYRVTVRAKNIRAPQFDDKTASDKFASHIDFRTLPKGMPDPPSEIQVEVGPQDGTLLVTWIPVTAENSNGAPITGYAVYADGKKVTDIDSPTGDHALIDISKIVSMNPKNVTVRTKSKENQSCDSNPTPIPASAIKIRNHVSGSGKNSNYNRHPPKNAYGQVIIDPEENLSDKEVYPQSSTMPSIEIMKENPQDENYSEEEFLETHRSTRNIRYNPSSPRSHESPRSHADRRGQSVYNTGHDRNLMRSGYESKNYDMRRENRDYHHSPNRSTDRRKMDLHLVKTGRSPPSASNRSHLPGANTSDDKCRNVVALFDFDPPSMSPNKSTCHEELPFIAGDRIKLLSDKDSDGFYWGECRGKQGYVPQNMIRDLITVSKMNKRGSRRAPASLPGPRGGRYQDIRHSANAKKMVALYDYDPHEHSPNFDSDAEISFNRGQIIYVKGEPDDDGYYLGEVDGMQGLIPSNFLQEIGEQSEGTGPGRIQENRGTVHPIPRDRNRGHGPGARGPPPPPRDGMPPRGDVRERRKDTRLQYENQQDQLRTQGRTDEQQHPERRTGRELPFISTDHYGNLTRENNTVANISNTSNIDSNRVNFRMTQSRGVTNIVPDASTNTKSNSAPTNSGVGLKFPESPNIMQKISEITGTTENPVDNILSKGKELIFMKFGLGK